MQWMYVEMQKMKTEMKKLQGKSSSGENHPLENQNSSFGDNQRSFQGRQQRSIAEESKQPV